MIGLPSGSLVNDLDVAPPTDINCCAQAAVATCVEHYCTGPFAGAHGEALVQEIYTRFPPNNPTIPVVNVQLGTSPQYVAQTVIPGVGLRGIEYSNNAGGNVENGITPTQWLSGALERQHPVICLVDAPKLFSGQQNFNCHYVVVYMADGPSTGNIWWANGLDGRECSDWPTFLDAWHVWFLSNTDLQSGMQYAGIEVMS
jgi:hypothetical protein